MTLETRTISETMIDVGVVVDGEFKALGRTEQGPLLRTAIATEALFEGEWDGDQCVKSAEQVQIETLGAPLHGKYRVNDPNGPDRNGVLIQYGQEFAYLDWNAPKVWHVYEFCTEEWTGPNTPTLDENGDTIPNPDGPPGSILMEIGPAWRRRGYHVNQAEAVAQAYQLAQAQGA